MCLPSAKCFFLMVELCTLALLSSSLLLWDSTAEHKSGLDGSPSLVWDSMCNLCAVQVCSCHGVCHASFFMDQFQYLTWRLSHVWIYVCLDHFFLFLWLNACTGNIKKAVYLVCVTKKDLFLFFCHTKICTFGTFGHYHTDTTLDNIVLEYLELQKWLWDKANC